MGLGSLRRNVGRRELRKNLRTDIGVMLQEAERGLRGAHSSNSHLLPDLEEVSPSPELFLSAALVEANHRSSLIHHVRQQPSTFSSGLVYLRTYQASNISLGGAAVFFCQPYGLRRRFWPWLSRGNSPLSEAFLSLDSLLCYVAESPFQRILLLSMSACLSVCFFTCLFISLLLCLSTYLAVSPPSDCPAPRSHVSLSSLYTFHKKNPDFLPDPFLLQDLAHNQDKRLPR